MRVVSRSYVITSVGDGLGAPALIRLDVDGVLHLRLLHLDVKISWLSSTGRKRLFCVRRPKIAVVWPSSRHTPSFQCRLE